MNTLTTKSVDVVRCVICSEQLPLSSATPGLAYADGSLAYACAGHTQDIREWAVGWAMFAAQQAEHQPLTQIIHRRSGQVASTVLARHLYVRIHAGPSAVLADNSITMHSSIRKQWNRLIAVIDREHAATLDPNLRTALTMQRSRMLAATFGTAANNQADVTFLESGASPRSPTTSEPCTWSVTHRPMCKYFSAGCCPAPR